MPPTVVTRGTPRMRVWTATFNGVQRVALARVTKSSELAAVPCGNCKHEQARCVSQKTGGAGECDEPVDSSAVGAGEADKRGGEQGGVHRGHHGSCGLNAFLRGCAGQALRRRGCAGLVQWVTLAPKKIPPAVMRAKCRGWACHTIHVPPPTATTTMPNSPCIYALALAAALAHDGSPVKHAHVAACMHSFSGVQVASRL